MALTGSNGVSNGHDLPLLRASQKVHAAFRVTTPLRYRALAQAVIVSVPQVLFVRYLTDDLLNNGRFGSFQVIPASASYWARKRDMTGSNSASSGHDLALLRATTP